MDIRQFFLILLAASFAPACSASITGPPVQELTTFLQRERIEAHLASKNKDVEATVTALRHIRDLQAQLGAFDSSLATAIKIVGMSGAVDDRKGMASDWQAMARTYTRLGNFSDAVDAQRRGLLILKTIDDRDLLGAATLDFLDLLLKADRLNEFHRQSESAKELFEKSNDPLGTAHVLLRQGESLIQQKRPADALSILHQAWTSFQTVGSPQDRSRTLFALARSNASLSRWAEARTEFDAAMALESDAVSRDPELLGLDSRIHEGNGDLKAALWSSRAQIRVEDSLLSPTMTERLLQLQAVYASQVSEKDIAQLRETNTTTTSDLSMARWKSRLAFFTIGALLTLMTIMLAIRRRSIRTAKRMNLKNAVLKNQSDAAIVKNLDLEEQNNRLSQLLSNESEKDAILKEIHERMRNNLEIVNSLLAMQGAYAKDERIDALFRDSRSRIHSMALVHEHIYKVGDLRRVNVKAHVMSLATSVLSNHGVQDRLKVDHHITYERSSLEELIPLSLLLNELLTNSARQVSRTTGEATVSITLRPLGEHRCVLLFTHIGQEAEQYRFLHPDDFGSDLIHTLAKQLNGTIHLLKDEGNTFQMTFEPVEGAQMRLAS